MRYMIDIYSKLESEVAYIMGHTQPNIPAYVTRVLWGKQKMTNSVVWKKEKKKQGELYQILTAKRAFSPIPVLFCSQFSFFFYFVCNAWARFFGSWVHMFFTHFSFCGVCGYFGDSWNFKWNVFHSLNSCNVPLVWDRYKSCVNSWTVCLWLIKLTS